MSGYELIFSGALVSWYSHTQSVVALSTAEAEYIALTDVAKVIVWMKLFLGELGYAQNAVKVLEDDQAAIRIAKNPPNHKRTKHMKARFHYIRHQIIDCVRPTTSWRIFHESSEPRATVMTGHISDSNLRGRIEHESVSQSTLTMTCLFTRQRVNTLNSTVL